MIVAFCGHASYISNPKDEERVFELLEKRVTKEACEFFLGVHGGFDRFACSCAKRFKECHRNVKLILITPYILSENSERYASYEKDQFDLIYYPALENIPPRYAISHRNRWIVDHADMIIAYVVNKYGGAYTMLRYAQRKNKEIYNLAERELD